MANALGAEPVISTTTEAVIATDQCQTVTFTNSNPVAATVAAAGSTGFPAGWKTSLLNLGAGTVTLPPAEKTMPVGTAWNNPPS